MQRSANQATQEESYSVKKKQCAFKNMLIGSRNNYIYFLGKTVRAGEIVDFNLLKKSIPSCVVGSLKWVSWMDLGYLGIQNWFSNQLILILYKKSRKSKLNPRPKVTAYQKTHNRFVGSNRVLIGPTIAGLKRYAIVANRFRNKTMEVADEMLYLAAGLCTFKVLKRLQ